MAESIDRLNSDTAARLDFSLTASTLVAIADGIAERVLARLDDAAATPTWLNAEQAAAHLGIAKSSLYRLARSGVVPAYQDGPGGRVFFHRDEIDRARRAMPI